MAPSQNGAIKTNAKYVFFQFLGTFIQKSPNSGQNTTHHPQSRLLPALHPPLAGHPYGEGSSEPHCVKE